MFDGFPQPFGPYELLRPLGRGGMAEVFLAQASSANGDARLVALKRMHAGVSEDSGAVEMLIEEARLAMRFNHPNIAASFELGCHGGAYYILMEYVDGLDLGAVARLAETLGERMDRRACAFAALGVARALAHAHELTDEDGQRLGVVHRDVSPQNILVNHRGELKLIDFGVAKVATRIQQTMAGVIKGKYSYMSPEQASAEKVDGRSDVFSLGICLHEWLTGAPLFRGPNLISPFAILLAVREQKVPRVDKIAPEVGAELAAIVARCLTRDLKRRYRSAEAVAKALEKWLSRNAKGYDADALRDYVDDLATRAPTGTVPQRSLLTPDLSNMVSSEFAPSEMSVVARAPMTGGLPRAKAPAFDFAGLSAVAPVPATKPSSRPRRRTVLQLLWVGLAALVFAAGWSVVATLKRLEMF
ncbi:MAG: serine/threonine protein kinase [Myxococcales bacterium]|nr:serine/threonine protein kinase [Myxococcales bacterium]